MTTLLVTENFPPRVGGSCRWLWDIFSRLPRKHVAIAAGECDGAEAFDLSHDLRTVRIPLGFRTWGVIGLQAAATYYDRYRRVSRITKQVRARSLFAARMLPEGLLALGIKKRFGLPFGCFVYGEELNFTSGSRELSFLARRVLSEADRLISCSRNTVRILTEQWKIPESKIHLLYPGVDASTYTPHEFDLSKRETLGWGNRPVILTTGRLQKRKGQDMMIRALPIIRRAIPNVLYAIVGDGEEHEPLRTLASGLGVMDLVRLHGALPDSSMLQCLQQCDLFTLPNRQVGQDIEGFGIVLIEAQACGKPVIVGNSGGTSETLDLNKTGTVIDCTTPDALASVATKWLKDRKRMSEMGLAARDWIVKHFDWPRLIERATELIAHKESNSGSSE